MRLLRLLPLLALLATAAYAQDKITLRYTPATDAKWKETLAGELAEVQVQGQPAGLTGSATADVEVQILKVDQEKGKTTIQISLKDTKSNLNGQVGQPSDPGPMKFDVDKLGKMSLPEGAKTELVSMVDTGGIPLQLVAMIAHSIRFPENPVAVGEEWTYEDAYELPGMGEAPLNTRWKLMKLEGNTATIAATAVAIIPDFKIPNPMAPGTDMDVRGARLNIVQMVLEYDTKDSHVVKNNSIAKLDARVDMGGFEMPLVITMKFELAPVEE